MEHFTSGMFDAQITNDTIIGNPYTAIPPYTIVLQIHRTRCFVNVYGTRYKIRIHQFLGEYFIYPFRENERIIYASLLARR